MRTRQRLLIAALVPLLAGCATLGATVDGWSGGTEGISRPQQRLRDAMAGGDYAAALSWREDDALLRALTTGITTYYAAQFARSAAVLDTAAMIADDRVTTSLSKAGLSLLTNDMAQSYPVRRTERLFVPYYGMLACARLGDWENAAVEARRLLALLTQYAADRDASELPLHGSLEYLAAAVLERAGERGEASVAYRTAGAMVAALKPSSTARALAPGEGEVLVVFERGFVAHRITETIGTSPYNAERDGFDPDRDAHMSSSGGGMSRFAPLLRLSAARDTGTAAAFRQREAVAPPAGTNRTVSAPADTGRVSIPDASTNVIRTDDGRRRRRPWWRRGDDDDVLDGNHLVIAFPALRRSARPWGGAPRLASDSGMLDTQPLVASIDDASVADERRERSAIVARAMARAAAKYAVTKAVREKKGEVAGSIADLGSYLLERADVRSWHLLPQEVTILRVRMPAGTHALRVQTGTGDAVRTVELGQVVVRAGAVTIVPARLWRTPTVATGSPMPSCPPMQLPCG